MLRGNKETNIYQCEYSFRCKRGFGLWWKYELAVSEWNNKLFKKMQQCFHAPGILNKNLTSKMLASLEFDQTSAINDFHGERALAKLKHERLEGLFN